MRNGIKGIIFDYGGVISRTQNENYVASILDLLGTGDHIAFFQAYWKFRPVYDLGAIRGEEFWENVAAELGLTCTQETIEQLINQDILSWMDVNPDMLEYVRDLKGRGFRLAVLSNMPVELYQYMKREFHWLDLFQSVVFSSEIGICKPDEKIFSHCMQLLGCKPDECIFIDDAANNVAGAADAGLYGLRFEDAAKLKRDLQAFL